MSRKSGHCIIPWHIFNSKTPLCTTPTPAPASQALNHCILERAWPAHKHFPLLNLRYRSPMRRHNTPRINPHTQPGHVHLSSPVLCINSCACTGRVENTSRSTRSPAGGSTPSAARTSGNSNDKLPRRNRREDILRTTTATVTEYNEALCRITLVLSGNIEPHTGENRLKESLVEDSFAL